MAATTQFFKTYNQNSYLELKDTKKSVGSEITGTTRPQSIEHFAEIAAEIKKIDKTIDYNNFTQIISRSEFYNENNRWFYGRYQELLLLLCDSAKCQTKEDLKYSGSSPSTFSAYDDYGCCSLSLVDSHGMITKLRPFNTFPTREERRAAICELEKKFLTFLKTSWRNKIPLQNFFAHSFSHKYLMGLPFYLESAERCLGIGSDMGLQGKTMRWSYDECEITPGENSNAIVTMRANLRHWAGSVIASCKVKLEIDVDEKGKPVVTVSQISHQLLEHKLVKNWFHFPGSQFSESIDAVKRVFENMPEIARFSSLTTSIKDPTKQIFLRSVLNNLYILAGCPTLCSDGIIQKAYLQIQNEFYQFLLLSQKALRVIDKANRMILGGNSWILYANHPLFDDFVYNIDHNYLADEFELRKGLVDVGRMLDSGLLSIDELGKSVILQIAHEFVAIQGRLTPEIYQDKEPMYFLDLTEKSKEMMRVVANIIKSVSLRQQAPILEAISNILCNLFDLNEFELNEKLCEWWLNFIRANLKNIIPAARLLGCFKSIKDVVYFGREPDSKPLEGEEHLEDDLKRFAVLIKNPTILENAEDVTAALTILYDSKLDDSAGKRSCLLNKKNFNTILNYPQYAQHFARFLKLCRFMGVDFLSVHYDVMFNAQRVEYLGEFNFALFILHYFNLLNENNYTSLIIMQSEVGQFANYLVGLINPALLETIRQNYSANQYVYSPLVDDIKKLEQIQKIFDLAIGKFKREYSEEHVLRELAKYSKEYDQACARDAKKYHIGTSQTEKLLQADESGDQNCCCCVM